MPSLGNLLFGLASITMGARLINNGFRRVAAPPATKPSVLGMVNSTAPSPMKLSIHKVRSLDDRIRYLQSLTEQGKRDPVIYEFARKAITQRCGRSWCIPEKDNLKELRAVFSAVRSNVRYTSDISGIDTYQKPRNTLKLHTADCDDYATLMCALSGVLGIPCRFKVIRTQGANDWNHIYAQAGLPRGNPTKWISLDASVDMPMGWEPPGSMVMASKVFRT